MLNPIAESFVTRSFSLLTIGLLMTACAPVESTPTDQSDAFSFAILGDAPYDPPTLERYERLIEDVNAQPDLAWVIHAGDMKGGIEPCTDEFFQERFELNQRFNAPYVLTPGDNDWYDCGREAAGGFNDYERLAALRQIFFPASGSAVSSDAVSQADFEAYPDYVENALWHKGGVTFSTVHILGPTRPPTDPDLAARDVAAASAWLQRTFEQAADQSSAGVFITIQADPWVFTGLPTLAKELCPPCNRPRPGLEWFYPLITELVMGYGRPVVLAVGDTHIFRVDKPLYDENGALVTNFTRLEVFGHPDVHWVRVDVDPDSRSVFSFHQQLVD